MKRARFLSLVLPLLFAGSALAAERDVPEAFLGCERAKDRDSQVRLQVSGEVKAIQAIAELGKIGCASIIVPGKLDQDTQKKVEIPRHDQLTAAGAYRLLVGALESAGLTVQVAGPRLIVSRM
jgi:hypothetical protein